MAAPARTPDPIPADLDDAIERLKRERDAVVLAHYYQDDAIQDLADHVGDSLALARVAQKSRRAVIAFCGVHFMAETAKILNPDTRVVVPDLAAGCSLADGCPADEFAAFLAEQRRRHPDLVVISYVNTSAAVKALSDVICTSSNAVQIVASLLNLQAGRVRTAEARTAFATARDRVRALATLHRHLYTHSDFETIALGTFLEELCGQLFEALGEVPGERIALGVAAPDIVLGSDEAVPLALIITEAVTNALKYAFPDGRAGSITVEVCHDGTTLTLAIRDDGVGIEAARESETVEQGSGLGSMLIEGFARQLGATLATRTEIGRAHV